MNTKGYNFVHQQETSEEVTRHQDYRKGETLYLGEESTQPPGRMLIMKSSTLLRAVSDVVLENARAWAEAAATAEAGGDGSFGVSRASGGVPAINDHSRRNASSDPSICFSV